MLPLYYSILIPYKWGLFKIFGNKVTLPKEGEKPAIPLKGIPGEEGETGESVEIAELLKVTQTSIKNWILKEKQNIGKLLISPETIQRTPRVA